MCLVNSLKTDSDSAVGRARESSRHRPRVRIQRQKSLHACAPERDKEGMKRQFLKSRPICFLSSISDLTKRTNKIHRYGKGYK